MIVLGNGTPELSLSVAEFYVQLYRRYRLHRNEREAVWSSVDQLITMQLMTAEMNKSVPTVLSRCFCILQRYCSKVTINP